MMGPINVLRGMREGAEFFDAAVAEFESLVAQGHGPLSEERFRTVVEGPPPYPFYKSFRNLFAKWGAVAVQSTYSTVGGIWEWGFRHDPKRPLESIAEQMLTENLTNRSIVARYAQIKRYVEEWEADALIIHSIKSCRLFSAGQGDMRDYFTRELGVPTLMVESDLEDPRYYAEAQIKNRIDAFFESLEHKKLVGRAAAAGEASNSRDQVEMSTTERIPTYCYQCVAGPDLLKVVVKDGVAVGVEPNCDMADTHPAGGKVCVRAYGLVQKVYNPARIQTPLRRTNPKKARGEDPGWEPISWDEALGLLAGKLNGIRAAGLTDASGYPRLAVTFGSGGIAPAYLGTFAALLAAWGPVDQGIGSGQGVKCYHSEHLYGEFWHRAFTVAADVPRCDYVLSFGYNGDASGGVTGVFRHAEARARGLHWVQLEPHMSITAAGAQEWVPVKPKTDAAVLFALMHTILRGARLARGLRRGVPRADDELAISRRARRLLPARSRERQAARLGPGPRHVPCLSTIRAARGRRWRARTSPRGSRSAPMTRGGP